jgi:hypothetical protein
VICCSEQAGKEHDVLRYHTAVAFSFLTQAVHFRSMRFNDHTAAGSSRLQRSPCKL